MFKNTKKDVRRNRHAGLSVPVLIALAVLTVSAVGCGKKKPTEEMPSQAESVTESQAASAASQSAPEASVSVKDIVLTQSVTSRDGRLSMELPDGWADMTGSFGDDGYGLHVGCPDEAALIMGGHESKTDSVLEGLKDYTETLYNGITDNPVFVNVQDGSVSPLTFGKRDLSGYVSRFTADAEGRGVAYWIYTAETETDYYQIVCWTDSANAKAEEAVFDAIMKSVDIS